MVPSNNDLKWYTYAHIPYLARILQFLYLIVFDSCLSTKVIVWRFDKIIDLDDIAKFSEPIPKINRNWNSNRQMYGA